MKKWISLCLLLAIGTVANASSGVNYVTEYYENGAVKVIYTYQGELLRFDYFYDNGQIKEVGFIKGNAREGTWTSYDENGNKYLEATYQNDIKTGTWKIWHANGQLQYKMTYENGTRMSVFQYDENAKLVAQR